MKILPKLANTKQEVIKLKNHLYNQTSPYLLQHSENPVEWYPWCDEAFEKAKKEDKPVFLSIGYSTCHWCHVMAHESFEDEKVAEILNKYFVSIKVDKEERPDIDSIYMSVCQAFTGGGGWPTSIFMTPEQKPFFAGTYFPKTSRYATIGFIELLQAINEKWHTDKNDLLKSADDIVNHIKQTTHSTGKIDENLINKGVTLFKKTFDKEYGGFGDAPKFLSPHNLLFLMNYYENSGDAETLKIIETTLMQMYRGGIFDHIGYGFSRYSTDRYFLVPHFEKMLYDNALLMTSYSKAFFITKKIIYKEVAEKIATYILREMTSEDGGFYCAQDADSDGVEGKYYVFDYNEIPNILGNNIGIEFNKYYDITKQGNFEEKNIPNLLNNKEICGKFDEYLPKIYEYRKNRAKLHLDDKILTSWNSLMIYAFTLLYRISDNSQYIEIAEKAEQFISKKLCENETLFVSYRDGKLGDKGFIDDYAFYIFALIGLYEATFNKSYLQKAKIFCDKAINDFYDTQNGGFYLYGKENEQLIITPKETYDGAIPSGNSVMAYNLVKLYNITQDNKLGELAENQLAFMSASATRYPAGFSFYLLALSLYLNPESITIVLKDKNDLKNFTHKISLSANLTIFENPTEDYKLLNDKTTFYCCKNHNCLPPTNEI